MLRSIITDADFFGGEPKTLSDISRYGSRGIILNEENMVGMILTGPNGFYKLPGGSIDLGERESDAFMRQVSEEIGYECKIIAPLGIVEEHKSRSNFCHISYAFIAKTVGECKKIRDDRKSDFSISWMSLQDAAAVMDKALEMCKEYGMMFMLKREKVILDYALKQIEAGEISIND